MPSYYTRKGDRFEKRAPAYGEGEPEHDTYEDGKRDKYGYDADGRDRDGRSIDEGGSDYVWEGGPEHESDKIRDEQEVRKRERPKRPPEDLSSSTANGATIHAPLGSDPARADRVEGVGLPVSATATARSTRMSIDTLRADDDVEVEIDTDDEDEMDEDCDDGDEGAGEEADGGSDGEPVAASAGDGMSLSAAPPGKGMYNRTKSQRTGGKRRTSKKTRMARAAKKQRLFNRDRQMFKTPRKRRAAKSGPGYHAGASVSIADLSASLAAAVNGGGLAAVTPSLAGLSAALPSGVGLPEMAAALPQLGGQLAAALPGLPAGDIADALAGAGITRR